LEEEDVQKQIHAEGAKVEERGQEAPVLDIRSVSFRLFSKHPSMVYLILDKHGS